MYAGLGFRRFKDNNQTFLSKLGWNMAPGEISMWTTLLMAKYLKNCSFFGAILKNKMIHLFWNEILGTKNLIH